MACVDDYDKDKCYFDFGKCDMLSFLKHSFFSHNSEINGSRMSSLVPIVQAEKTAERTNIKTNSVYVMIILDYGLVTPSLPCLREVIITLSHIN